MPDPFLKYILHMFKSYFIYISLFPKQMITLGIMGKVR